MRRGRLLAQRASCVASRLVNGWTARFSSACVGPRASRLGMGSERHSVVYEKCIRAWRQGAPTRLGLALLDAYSPFAPAKFSYGAAAAYIGYNLAAGSTKSLAICSRPAVTSCSVRALPSPNKAISSTPASRYRFRSSVLIGLVYGDTASLTSER